MIYWYTGQPGHGKTLHAIERAMQFKDQGRLVYVCNVRDFDYQKTGMEKMTPDQFREWMTFLPDGAVALVDECYEHGMLPKRASTAAVPVHVQELAKHRHRGLDFIFVCQSPDKQCDSFTHDLIERHIHVRRRFGTKFVHLREFDRFERNPEKGHPLVIKRVRLPKRPMGSYKSTELDTTERRIPWYYFAFALGVPLALWMMYSTFGSMGTALGGDDVPVAQAAAQGGGAPQTHGAPAPGGVGATKKPESAVEHLAKYTPRVASQPWSAPAYDGIGVPSDAPRVFCMASDAGDLVDGVHGAASCSCVTEQGTRYVMPAGMCRMIARNGQYEPLLDERSQEHQTAETQTQFNREALARRELDGTVPGGEAAAAVPAGGGGVIGSKEKQVTGYGDIGAAPAQKIYGTL